jgi:transposase InsO family protein
VLGSRKARDVMASMEAIGPWMYDNILTDNGWQFLDRCPEMREYRSRHIAGRHIHITIRHPQTLGKLSAYQKHLKRFLDWTLGETRDKTAIEERVQTYNLWYNNGRPHSAIGGYPEEVYSGMRNKNWFDKFIKRMRCWRCISPFS